MGEVLGGFGIVGILIFLFLAIILPISVYSCQKWAFKCFKDLEKLNQNMDLLLKTNGHSDDLKAKISSVAGSLKKLEKLNENMDRLVKTNGHKFEAQKEAAEEPTPKFRNREEYEQWRAERTKPSKKGDRTSQ